MYHRALDRIHIWLYIYLDMYVYLYARWCISGYTCISCMTVSTENATPPRSTKSRSSDSSVSGGTNSNWDFGLIWICPEESEFLDFVLHAIIHMRIHMYIKCGSFHQKCCIPEIHQTEELRFLGIWWYKFKFRFWTRLNLYWGIWVLRFGGFRGRSIYSGICHTLWSMLEC